MILSHYKKIGYDNNVLQQTACLVVNPITVGNFAFLFNCTPVGQTSDEDHSKLPTLYWLPKLHKRPYKSRFIANSSACTTTELSILLTSCLTAIKNHVIEYCTIVYERNGKNLFWSITRVIFYVRREVDLMKTAKENAYIMHIFGKIELLSIHAT